MRPDEILLGWEERDSEATVTVFRFSSSPLSLPPFLRFASFQGFLFFKPLPSHSDSLAFRLFRRSLGNSLIPRGGYFIPRLTLVFRRAPVISFLRDRVPPSPEFHHSSPSPSLLSFFLSPSIKTFIPILLERTSIRAKGGPRFRVDSGYPELFSGVEQELLVEFVLEGNDDYGKWFP